MMMGDTARSVIMNRSGFMGSTRKDNSEEVAKRRAAMQQQIEQRQKLARKLQDEKMARAVAQKEERLLKQREIQHREMLRAKAVLDRRAQVLAEKEKEKKEAVLAKVHAVASRLAAQHKTRPVYAFGSSTPRELGYLTQLTKEQKVYDRKLTPSDRSPTAASGSSGRLTSTPPNGSRNHTPGVSMTRSLYVARPELKTRHKPISNNMTQSVMVTSKPIKTAAINQSSAYRRSMAQRPVTATKTLPSRNSEIPKTATKRGLQQMYGHKSRTTEPKSSEVNNEVLKPKPVPRRVPKPAESKINGEAQEAKAKLEKSSRENTMSTFMILEKDDAKMQEDISNAETRNIIDTEESKNKSADVNGIRKLDEKNTAVEASEEELKKTGNEASNEVGDKMGNDDTVMGEEAVSGNPSNGTVETITVEDAPLLDYKQEENDNIFIETNADNTVEIINANTVFDQKSEKQIEVMEEEKDAMKEAQDEKMLQTDVPVPMESNVPVPVESNVPVSMESNVPVPVESNVPAEVTAVNDEQKKSERAMKVQEEVLPMNEEFPKDLRNIGQDEIIVQKTCEIAEVKEESSVSVMNENAAVVEKETLTAIQQGSTLDGTECIEENSKLMEEKRLVEERRRAQEERLEKEQREREMRKAKLASIMSRTRGTATPMAVVPPTKNIKTSEVVPQEPLKPTDRLPSPVESAPMKSALSHTAASVLQKLATTNPKLLSVLQRNGSSQSLADELSAADPTMSMTLPGQPDEPIVAHEGSSAVRHLPFEPDVNHRPVAMK